LEELGGSIGMVRIASFWNDEQGQDLIEYSLLISFITIAVAGLFLGAGGNVKNVWVASGNQLAKANTAAS
jgi:Flp pilus assembly pilin Flp